MAKKFEQGKVYWHHANRFHVVKRTAKQVWIAADLAPATARDMGVESWNKRLTISTDSDGNEYIKQHSGYAWNLWAY